MDLDIQYDVMLSTKNISHLIFVLLFIKKAVVGK